MHKPFHMAHMIDTLSWGGAQKLLVTFAEAAREQGFMPTVISLQPRDQAPFYAELEALGVRIVLFPCRSLFAPRQIIELVRFLRQERFAILHTHLYRANILGALVGYLSHTPVVTSLHNTHTRKRRFQAIRELLETIALRYGTRRVIAVGHGVATTQQGRLKETCLDVIPNAVGSLPNLSPAERTRLRQQLVGDSSRPILLSVGRLTAQKGYADLIAAFAIVHQADPTATLVIAGMGELQADLEAEIVSLGLEGHAFLTGPRDDIPRVLAAADLYVSAAHWEGLPVSVLEALSAGLPVIATAVGDIPHVLVEGTGLTVPPHQPQLLADAIVRMLHDPEEMRRYGAAARAHARQSYSSQAWLEQLLALYQALLADDGNHASRLSVQHPRQNGVMMLVNSFPPLQTGGAERQAERLAGYIGTQGWAVRVITRHAEGLPAHEQRDGFQVQRLPACGPGKLSTIVFTLATMLALFWQRRDYSILHAHLAFAPAVAAAVMGRLLGKHVIVKFGNSGTYGDIQASRRSWRGRLKLAILRRWVDTCIALDRQMEQELVAAGFPAQRVVRMVNGIDPAAFQRQHDRQAARVALALEDRRVVLFLGRLAPQKALPDLLTALAQARRSCPHLHLLLVGDGPERGVLERLVRDLGLDAAVTFVGAVANVQPYLDAAEIFVLPSLAEGISNALLEAMAAGLACIATATGGSPEVLADGACGLLVPPERPDLLGKAIATVADQPDAINYLGHTARARIESTYAFAVVGQAYLTLYQSLLLPQRDASAEHAAQHKGQQPYAAHAYSTDD